MNRTTYCIKHEALEDVETVKAIKPFEVHHSYPSRMDRLPVPTGKLAVEVKATTDKGCNVRFIGSGWKKGAA